MVPLLVAAGFIIASPKQADAQILPARVMQPGVARQPGDTLGRGRDTTVRDTLSVKWIGPDSVMQALLSKPGYQVTRFQGSFAVFEAGTRSLELLADSNMKAQVQRGTQMAVSDTVISYREGQSLVEAGGRYCVRDPQSSQATMICGEGALTYDFDERAITSTNARTQVNNGEPWNILWERAKIVSDSGRGATMYLGGAQITSCLEPVPDYYLRSEYMKRTVGNTMILGPSVLYLTDGRDSASAIPVMWFPFFFQAIKGGRGSGILTPRFGFSDIVRNSPSYRRNIENLGYFWALNDYMNASLALDWRSGAGGDNQNTDPGWTRWQGDWDYVWLDRALSGGIKLGYTRQGNGLTNKAVNWNHDQRFSHGAALRMSLNYVTSTRLQRQNTFDPYAVTATIRSSINYSRHIGPAELQIGGSRTQYPGRPQVDQTFPTIAITSQPLKLFGEGVVWQPSVSYSFANSRNLDQQGPFSYRFNGPGDSTALKRSNSTSQLSVNSPLKVFGVDLSNAVRISSTRNDFPQQFMVLDVVTGDTVGTRIYGATYRTDIDWTPGFQLPSIGRNFANIQPSITLANVDAGPFWIKTERTNGKFAHQAKRLSFSLSSSPGIYGLFPGFGPFQRIRHAMNPTISYGWAPAAKVSNDYLQATGRTRKGYLGSLEQSAVSFGMSQSVEAKLRAPGDSGSTTQAEKVKLLSITMSSFAYDFKRADTLKATNHHWWRGLTTERFSYTVGSDLLPGVNLSVDYSLFQGNTWSDTAVFSPYRENVSASINLGRGQNPWTVLTKLFGRAVPEARTAPVVSQPQPPGTTPTDQLLAQQLAQQPVAGAGMAGARMITAPSQGWRLALTFSSARSRPPKGGSVIEFDPRVKCEAISQGNPFYFTACLEQAQLNPTGDLPLQSTTQGGQVFRIPARSNAGADFGFALTEKWTAAWRTNYDFERREFAAHVVSLQRDLHDWRAIFAFTQSPNGNFAFNFSIGLKAQSDVKFDYNRATVRAGQVF